MLKISIKGGKTVERLLKHKHRKLGKGREAVVIGYGGGPVDYAIYVHEDIRQDINWTTPGTGPQFLVQPAQENLDDLRDHIAFSVKQGKTLKESLVSAGQYLLEVSEDVTPKDTGDLRESGFVRSES